MTVMNVSVWAAINLTLYVLCVVFKCVDKPTRYNVSYEWSSLSINPYPANVDNMASSYQG